MTTETITFQVGDRVRVDNERSTYKVWREEPGPDGSILLYGGDQDPNGVRGFRSVMPNRLSIDKRKVYKPKPSK
jgi:hypothetical protein